MPGPAGRGSPGAESPAALARDRRVRRAPRPGQFQRMRAPGFGQANLQASKAAGLCVGVFGSKTKVYG